ncbi:regulator of G-protein signaling 8 [Clonorchis sinensis]|uniref:Regulator of G-protein signaling 8 n=1 Tax=Clonorchis sinensis TaxID=79923 RepID=G7Y7B5_CLOSI|nr:regulator of G-protein signaling 8 [Clonorchis sinensis]
MALPEDKLAAIVQYVGKLSIAHQIVISQTNLTRKLLPLKQKADQKQIEGIKLTNIALFEAIHDRLLIRFTSKILRYSGSDLIDATVLDDDRRFFYMIMRAPDFRCPADGGSGQVYVPQMPYQHGRATGYLQGILKPQVPSGTSFSCFLFRCLPPSLLGHRSHTDIVNQFQLTCHRDRLTGVCAEFPRNAETVVRVLRHIIDLPMKGFANLMETPANQCRSNFVAMQAASTCGFQQRNTRLIAGRDSFSDVGIATPQLPMVVLADEYKTHLALLYAIDCLIIEASPYAARPSRLAHRASLPPVTPQQLRTSFLHSASLDGLQEYTEDHEMASVVSSTDLGRSNYDPPCLDFDYFLNDPAAIRSFRAFLSSEYSSEHLDFWLSVRDWRATFSSPQTCDSARTIFNTFIDPNSSCAVNINQDAVKQASNHLSCPHVDMFAQAERQVYQLMKMDPFPRFLDSQFYRDFLTSLRQRSLEGKENFSATTDMVTSQCTPNGRPTGTVTGRLSTRNCGTVISTPNCRMSLDKMIAEDPTPVPRLRSACRSWSTRSLGKPGSISVLLLPSGDMTAMHRKGVTAEDFFTCITWVAQAEKPTGDG